MHSVAIVGAGGFTGRELLRWIARHPQLKAVYASSDRFSGRPLAQQFPELEGALELEFAAHSAPIPAGAVVLLAAPNETAMAMAPELLQAGHRIIDLGGAFRLHDRDAVKRYYGFEAPPESLLRQAVFGIPELFAERIASASLVANPGCFPTTAIAPLALLGELRQQIRAISIDAKSGVSGAGGRTEDGGFSFHSVYENFRAYKILRHQHEPEIREYAFDAGTCPPLLFTPHLLPVYRGILSTIAVFWEDRAPPDLEERLRSAALQMPFLRFLSTPEEVELARVQNTNFLDIGLRSEGQRTIVVTALDNLVKGAAGQALQNLNLMLGLPQSLGLLATASPHS
ncbi:MAG: N-acetyl-gamma-glutamyl-phosphate reductase [Leptospirales bacterium]|nr:N-acetyl-gamma-glutamyl-phosphate reductase [Leptospirales bacterium]